MNLAGNGLLSQNGAFGERRHLSALLSPLQRLLDPLVVGVGAEALQLQAVILHLGIGVGGNALHPQVLFLGVGEAVNPVGCIEVVGAAERLIHNLVLVADTIVVALV